MLDKVKAYVGRPEVRSALYRLALVVSAFLAAKYAVDGSYVAIVNGLLAVLFGVADANVPRGVDPAPEPVEASYPDAPYMVN